MRVTKKMPKNRTQTSRVKVGNGNAISIRRDEIQIFHGNPWRTFIIFIILVRRQCVVTDLAKKVARFLVFLLVRVLKLLQNI